MFEDSLVESAALLRSHNRWPTLFSLATQCAIAALIVSLPLLHPELLPMPHVLPATLAPPRAPTPPPPAYAHAAPSAASTAAVPAAPNRAVFHNLLHPTGPAVDAPTLPIVDVGNTPPTLALGINSSAPVEPHITVEPASARPSSKPMNVSSGVFAGNLIAPIRPVYPEIARLTHTEGTVVIDATISRTGSIESAHVLSGSPMLGAAALDAVRQARYRPFLLNGQPTEVQTTITIVFRMDG